MAGDPRTLLASERTLLAWLRTGVSLITFGFFIAKLGLWLHTQPNAPSAPRSAAYGSALVFLGAVTELIGIARYLRVRRAVLAGRPTPTGAVDVLGIAVAAALVGLLLGLHMVMLS
jgi:putative membrane protein